MSEFIKKANELSEYNTDNLIELEKCANDVIYFCTNYVKVTHPTKGAVPFEPYPYQIRMLEAFRDHRFNLVLAGRQLGKSTVIAMYMLHCALFDFDKNFLVASNKEKNAIEIMERIRFAYEELPFWLKPGVVQYNTKTIKFDNGCKIDSQATSPTTGRGGSFAKILIDELAFVPKKIQEEMWTSITPTISTGGSLIVSSTPNGDSDLFASLYRKAKSGDDGFNLIQVEWNEHPDRDNKYKVEMIQKIGEQKWFQEYECIDGEQVIELYDSLEKKIIKVTMEQAYHLCNY